MGLWNAESRYTDVNDQVEVVNRKGIDGLEKCVFIANAARKKVSGLF